jgi:DNA-binding CsgD family transcriptional regulator
VAAGRKFYTTVVRRYKRRDGTVISAEIHNVPLYDESGTLIAQQGTIRDVSDRERTLVELHVAAERAQKITQWLPDLLVKLDESGLVTEHIPTASLQPARAFVGKRLVDTVTDEFRTLATNALQRALAGSPSAFRAIVRIGDEDRAYEFRITPTGDGTFGAVLRDVTGESVTLTDEQRQLARDKSDVVAGSGIEYRNPYRLTFREFAVLALVARGATDKEIAQDLGIALSTVNNHVSNLLRKMGATSRTEAGVRAVQEGIVSYTVPGGRPTR